jgi:hypothetical protein
MTGANITHAGYIIHDGETILATGQNPDEAWVAARDYLRDAGVTILPVGARYDGEQGGWIYQDSLQEAPATYLLLDRVSAKGGDCGWYSLGGIACTREEVEAHSRASRPNPGTPSPEDAA